MVTYEYRCQQCGKQFTREEHISEHGAHPPRCPECAGDKVQQVPSAVYVKTGKKS